MRNPGIKSPSTYWDDIARSWELRSPQRLWRMHSDAVCLDLLNKHFLPDFRHRVLKTDLFDEAIACGVLPLLISRCSTVIGCDISCQTIRMARRRGLNVSFVAADVRGFPFCDESFNWIVSLSTLDHLACISEIEDSLHETFRILKTGGKLLMTLDNLANPIIALRNFLPFQLLHKMGIAPYTIGATCGPWRLRKILAQAGFRVELVRSSFHIPRVLAIPLMEWLDRHASSATKQKALDWLMQFEGLENWPTHFLTGHLIFALSQKP
jgi:SAM-dependent methyltransferase